MVMTELILQYLNKYNEVKISGFGTFSLEDSTAFYDEKSAALLPPGKQIFFNIDYKLENQDFVDFLIKNDHFSKSEAHSKLEDLTVFWKNTLAATKELTIENLGKFYSSDDNLIFKGNHFTLESPENFGLETLNLEEFKKNNSSVNAVVKKEYKTSKNPLWYALLVIPVVVIVYFAVQKPELIFGKKSFKNLTKSARVVPPKKLQQDTLQTKSVKTDSIKSK